MGKYLVLPVAILLFATTVWAQIEGDVVDENAKPIAGATISAGTPKSNVAATAKSDERGFYALKGLKRGKYRVEATAPGFKPAVYENVEVYAEKESGKQDISNATRLQIVLTAQK